MKLELASANNNEVPDSTCHWHRMTNLTETAHPISEMQNIQNM